MRVGVGDCYHPAAFDPGPPGPAWASAVTMLLGGGATAVAGRTLLVDESGASGGVAWLAALEDACDALHADVGGGVPAAARPDRFGVLEAVLAERHELDGQVQCVCRLVSYVLE